MASVEIVDDMICVERAKTGVSIRVGSLLTGKKPDFEMLDEAWLDELPPTNDEKAFDDAVDKRFFIKKYPLHIYKLDKKIKAKIAALPPGSTIRSDGALISIELLDGVNEAEISDAIDIARALADIGRDKLSFVERFPGAQRQPRRSWAECPDPQFVLVSRGVTIEVSISWNTPTVLQAKNRGNLPAGILSLNKSGFIPYNEQAKPLLQALESVNGQELASAFEPARTSFYSSMGDKNLRVLLYSDLNDKVVGSAVELLARLAQIEIPEPVNVAPSVVVTREGQVIDEVICLQKTEGVTLIHVGPVCVGEGPIFEMRDQSFFDTIKKIFFVEDHRVYMNKEVDNRFFITDHPGHLSNVESSSRDEMYQRMLTLPLGAVLRMDGQILTIQLPPRVADDVLNSALQLAKILCKIYPEKFSIIEKIPGIQRQPRASWEHCPDPQFLMSCYGVMIEISVEWRGFIILHTANSNALPQGMLSMTKDGFSATEAGYTPLLRAVEKANGQELALIIGRIASLYCDMGHKRLQMLVHSELTQERMQAAIELLARLAMPKSDGPFR